MAIRKSLVYLHLYCLGGFSTFEEFIDYPFGSSCHHNETEGIFLFNIMKYNLLQNKYDKLCDSFINGKISLCIFQSLEYVFIRDSFLFTINLN